MQGTVQNEFCLQTFAPALWFVPSSLPEAAANSRCFPGEVLFCESGAQLIAKSDCGRSTAPACE